MKNSYKVMSDQLKVSNLEISEAQIIGGSKFDRIKYPRHLNQRLSPNHRHYGAIFRSNFSSPKTCSISHEKSGANALHILRYQLQDETAKKAHLENLKLNLERRLKTAKAEGNSYLINLLQQESKELEFN